MPQGALSAATPRHALLGDRYLVSHDAQTHQVHVTNRTRGTTVQLDVSDIQAVTIRPGLLRNGLTVTTRDGGTVRAENLHRRQSIQLARALQQDLDRQAKPPAEPEPAPEPPAEPEPAPEPPAEPEPAPGDQPHPCPSCPDGVLQQSSRGTTLRCSNHPECRYLSPRCPQCSTGYALLDLPTRRAHCTNPQCQHPFEMCPQCETGILALKTTQANGERYWGCNRYWSTPRCSYRRPDQPETNAEDVQGQTTSTEEQMR